MTFYNINQFLNETRCFGSRLCFHLQASRAPNLVEPLDRAQWLRISVSKGSTRLGALLCLKTEAESASETSCFIKNIRQWKKSKMKIMSVRHIPSSEPYKVELNPIYIIEKYSLGGCVDSVRQYINKTVYLCDQVTEVWTCAIKVRTVPYIRFLHLVLFPSNNIKTPLQLWSSWSQRPRGLRHGSAAVRFLGLWVRIPSGHGCLSLVSVVCCQVEVCASSWSLVQRDPTECGVFLTECDRKASIMRKPWPTSGSCAMGKIMMY
jgi:hypothetical protein